MLKPRILSISDEYDVRRNVTASRRSVEEARRHLLIARRHLAEAKVVLLQARRMAGKAFDLSGHADFLSTPISKVNIDLEGADGMIARTVRALSVYDRLDDRDLLPTKTAPKRSAPVHSVQEEMDTPLLHAKITRAGADPWSIGRDQEHPGHLRSTPADIPGEKGSEEE